MEKMDETDQLDEVWLPILRRLVNHSRNKTEDMSDEPVAVPAKFFNDEKQFKQEIDNVILTTPLLAAASVDIPTPGDRVVFSAAGRSALIVRAKDYSVNAFINSCAHRGATLVEHAKPADSILCPYHGWRYSLQGEVVHQPRSEAFDGLDKDSYNLTRLPAAEKYGLIFVTLDPESDEIDIDTFLGDMAPSISHLQMENAIPIKSEQRDVNANWKITVNSFCEVYHVPVSHSRTLSENMLPYVSTFDSYGIHARFAGAARDFKSLENIPEEEWPNKNFAAGHFVFPLTIVGGTDNIDGSSPLTMLFRLVPGENVGETTLLCNTYIPPYATNKNVDEYRVVHDAMFQSIVMDEDIAVVEANWKSLKNAPANFNIVLGRNEPVLQEFYLNLAAYMKY